MNAPGDPRARLRAEREAQERKAMQPGQTGRPKRGRASERWKKINRFMDCDAASVSANAALVWTFLWRHERDGITSASLGDIARRLPLSRRTAANVICELRRAGLLGLVKRGHQNGTPNVYRLLNKETT